MIIDIVDSVRDGRDTPRDIRAVIGIMIHRCGIDLNQGFVLGHDAETICNAFLGRIPQWAEVAKATGGENPYTFFVGGDVGPLEHDGQVWQALELDEVGHHARRFSRPYIGVGCIGDFRVVPPSLAQLESVVDLCSDLCGLFGFDPDRIKGHGEVPGAHGGNKGPGRPAACPGDTFDMDNLRDQVQVAIAGKAAIEARHRLVCGGLRIT